MNKIKIHSSSDSKSVYMVSINEDEAPKFNAVDNNVAVTTFALEYDGIWWKCIEKGMKPANSCPYKTVKAAIRNSWYVK